MAAPTPQDFAGWQGLLDAWIDDIGYPRNLLGDFRLEPKYEEPPNPLVEFGAFKGAPKWRRPGQAPTQAGRDALLTLTAVQGDTGFASVEQQRHLVATAPTAYDLKSLVRVNAEEMRHGLQMAHILMTHFGRTGAIEAQKLLERRATRGERLLKAFNDPVRHWLDFFCYTAFMDRDGKYQLTMLQRSGFHPLAASMGPMLKEEAFHLGTGFTGVKRIVQAGLVPIPVLQTYVNWWVTAAYDCFGTDSSTSAQWAYEWGLKGRFDEATNPQPAPRERLNEYNRSLYAAEVADLLCKINQARAPGQPALRAPSTRFHRRVGPDAGQPYSTTGARLSDTSYADHLRETLPTGEDEGLLAECFKEAWIAPRAA
ncbi:MAG: phenylacetate-CoA oxygenase subunit PaaI [Euryarchaeota archaeon]|nr:phenylacetate-CoA oxygenase subunit PaaI [Euryarchaeota archaeon]